MLRNVTPLAVCRKKENSHISKGVRARKEDWSNYSWRGELLQNLGGPSMGDFSSKLHSLRTCLGRKKRGSLGAARRGRQADSNHYPKNSMLRVQFARENGGRGNLKEKTNPTKKQGRPKITEWVSARKVQHPQKRYLGVKKSLVPKRFKIGEVQ